MGRRKEYLKSALIRLTPDEHIRLMAAAQAARLSLSRFLVLAGLTGKASTYEDRERHERAIIEIKRVGNNLNQIARQLNAQRGSIKLSRLEESLAETKEALEMIGKLMQQR